MNRTNTNLATSVAEDLSQSIIFQNPNLTTLEVSSSSRGEGKKRDPGNEVDTITAFA